MIRTIKERYEEYKRWENYTLDYDEILHLSKQECSLNVNVSQFNIISVGRLEKVKGFDKLIPIIRNVREKGIDVHLWIVGEGTEEKTLKQLVVECGLENDVTFTGFLKNPYALMSKMNLFVCSSFAEGFSLVIAEAMLLGVPVVSMNCAGPQELIRLCGVGSLCESYEELEQEIPKRVGALPTQEGAQMSFDVRYVIPQIENILATC